MVENFSLEGGGGLNQDFRKFIQYTPLAVTEESELVDGPKRRRIVKNPFLKGKPDKPVTKTKVNGPALHEQLISNPKTIKQRNKNEDILAELNKAGLHIYQRCRSISFRYGFGFTDPFE